MNQMYNQLPLAQAMMPGLFNSAQKASQESSGLGRRLAAHVGNVLVAIGKRLQVTEPTPALNTSHRQAV